MKASNYETMAAGGRVHPVGHAQEHEGPWSLRIGPSFQPAVVRAWTTKGTFISMEQLNEDDNFTLIWVLYLRNGTKKPNIVAELKFHRARWYRRSNGEIDIRIKKRYGNSFSHPIPTGRYTGICTYDVGGGFGLFVLQAVTLRKEPGPLEPKTIITPGDKSFGITLKDAARTLSGADGLGGRGANAGGLRDGQLPDSVPSGSSRESMG